MAALAKPLVPLLEAARFSKLFWIDDRFAQAPDKLVTIIAKRIEAFWAADSAANARLNHPALKKFSRNWRRAFIETRVSQVLSDDLTKADEIIQSIDEQIREKDPDYTEVVRDLSAGQFDAIKAAFESCGVTTRTMGYAEWSADWKKIKKVCDSGSLFLVDHNFEGEEGCDEHTGEEILKVLIKTDKPFSCVLLTHEATKDDEATHRNLVCERIKNKKPYKFAVVSKEHLTEKAANGAYAPITNALRDAFVREWCHSVATHSKSLIRKAHDDTDALLMDMRLDEIATCLFRKPHDDGTFEFDALLRLFSLAGRISLQDNYHSSPLWAPLGRIRRVMNVPPLPTSKILISPKLKPYRDREVFDPAEAVNRLFSPPYLGDVFAVKAAKPSYYILLAQPCDLVVRGKDGWRKASEAMLVPIEVKPPKDEAFAFEFEFPGIEPRWIWFNKAFAVNLYVLDMASFNAEGKVCMDSAFKESDIMLPGVALRFEKAKKHLKSIGDNKSNFVQNEFKGTLGPRISRLISHDQIKGVSPTVTSTRIEFDIQRYGRVRSPYAETILSRFAIYHTRTAFDFDFSSMADYQPEPPAAA